MSLFATLLLNILSSSFGVVISWLMPRKQHSITFKGAVLSGINCWARVADLLGVPFILVHN